MSFALEQNFKKHQSLLILVIMKLPNKFIWIFKYPMNVKTSQFK